MKETSQILPVSRGPYRLHAEIVPGGGLPVVLMHGFPDGLSVHGRQPGGRPGAVIGAVDEQADAGQLTPVAHDASGPSAIDW
jgi:hypothetical protein